MGSDPNSQNYIRTTLKEHALTFRRLQRLPKSYRFICYSGLISPAANILTYHNQDFVCLISRVFHSAAASPWILTSSLINLSFHMYHIKMFFVKF